MRRKLWGKLRNISCQHYSGSVRKRTEHASQDKTADECHNLILKSLWLIYARRIGQLMTEPGRDFITHTKKK